MSRPLPSPDSTKQFACPSKLPVIGWPAACWQKLSVKISTEKWATEPAFEVGMLLASPTAKMLSYCLDSSVCLSTAT